MLERLVDKVQQAYDDHRAPETWGTPEVSPGFFDHLGTGRIRSAWDYLVERERTLGDLRARPEIKAIANLLGSALLVLGVRQMSGISDEELHEAEYVPSIRQRVGEAAFNMTLGLLFFAQDGGTSYVGYLGRDSSQCDQAYRVDLTRSEQACVESEFDPSTDGCHIDTAARLFPDKLKKA